MTPDEMIKDLRKSAMQYSACPQDLIEAANAIEQLQIEAAHWREAYYDERSKYLNLINNK